jgi:hypothetical protein
MSYRNHTGIVTHRLSGNGNGQTQTWSAGGEMSWLMKSLPKLTDGKLCNKMLGLIVTIAGSYTSIATAESSHAGGWPGSDADRANVRTMWDTIRALVESVEVRSAWHGTPISSQHVKGSMLQLIETVGNGMSRPFRQRPPLRTMVGETTVDTPMYFRYSFFLPLCLLAGRKGHHTALPAVLYKNSEFVINCGTGNPNAWQTDVLGTTTFDVSAALLPENEITLGPGVSWIDYQQHVSGEAVDINGLGAVRTLDSVEPGAGIAGLFWLSNRLGLPGPGQVKHITDLTFPLRGIVHTKHLDPIITQLENIMDGPANPPTDKDAAYDGDGTGTPKAGDYAGFPYDDFDVGTGELGASNTVARIYPPNPVVLGLVVPGRDFEVTKCQVSDGTQQLQMQHVSGTPAVDTGTHHILALQLHSWTPAAFASAMQIFIEEGLCRAVENTDDVEWSLKVLNKQDPTPLSVRKRRFMAMKIVPKAGAQVKVA